MKMSIWNIFRRKTEAERKRDDYYKLYTKLSSVLDRFDREENDATSAYQSYRASSPFLSPSKIPSNDFVVKRDQLNQNLNTYFANEKNKRAELVVAKNRAYSQYEYYRNLAITEAENYEREKNKN